AQPGQAPAKPKPQHFSESLFGSNDADQPAPPDLATSEGHDYQCVDTEEKFELFLELLKQQKRFAFDTETTALGAMNSRLVGMSFSWKPGTGYYVPVLA